MFKGSDTEKKVQLNADDSYLMVIPQNLSTDGFDVAITYKVDGDGAPSSNGSAVANVKLNLESGKAYTLNLYLIDNSNGDDPHPGLLSPIVISSEVADWDNADSTNLDTSK